MKYAEMFHFERLKCCRLHVLSATMGKTADTDKTTNA